MCALHEILETLADGETHELAELRAGIAVYSGCAEWLECRDLDHKQASKSAGKRRVRITERGLRERARHATGVDERKVA